MKDFSQIKIKYIPAIFPDYRFEDRKYVFNRVVRKPEARIEMVKTDKVKTTLNTALSKEEKIQSVLYDLYELELRISENQKIDYIRAAGKVIIIDTFDNDYEVELTALEYEKQADTFFYLVRFEFYQLAFDVNAISNYLEKTHIQNIAGSIINRLSLITYDSSEQLDFYTIIEPKLSRSEIEKNEITLNTGVKVLSNTFDYAICRIPFYLNESDYLSIKKYGIRSNSVNLYTYNYGTFTPEEYIKIIEGERNAELVDLYEVFIEIYYDFINHYHFDA